MTLTDVQPSVTKTAAFTGAGIDISGITGDWTIKLQVSSLTAAKQVRLGFEDTINDWTASIAGPQFGFKGALASTYDKVKSFKKADFPNLRFGTASAQLRCKASEMDAATSATWRAWLEY